ncbi:hypothetical protein VTL71DRAFT_10753 [Oculimacula yallundae]|uniref:Uncharacterized protein n=1 Tax=Oculimacula yallundae TaxID=86028 RepID=A0ABR4CWH7_9HELO
MAKSDHSDEIFQDCVEGMTPDTSPASKSEQSGSYQSTPATENSDSTITSSAQTPRIQTTQEKYQVARAEYDNKRYVACRDKCMELLRNRNLGPITRCETLQLFASCSYYYGAKHALEQALIVANRLGDSDPDQVLRKNVEELLEDLEQYRPVDGAPRAYIKEFEYDD